MLEIGQSASIEIIVTEAVIASTLGSGSLAVYATPSMIAHMEIAATRVINPHIDDSQTSVGIEMNIKHLKAIGLGKTTRVTASITAIDDKRISFAVQAHSGDTLIGEGTHNRFIVDIERFLARL